MPDPVRPTAPRTPSPGITARVPRPGEEFQEIGHCGGQVTVTVVTDRDGRRGVSFGLQNSSPTPAAWFGVYALPQGIPVGTIQLGGIGQPWNPAPHRTCLPVFIASDSTGLFGHSCAACETYWRSQAAGAAWPLTCPGCGYRGSTHELLTEGQRRFVAAFCEFTVDAMSSGTDGEHVIDIDKIAETVQAGQPLPAFYYTEESQQHHYTCAACGNADDILGRYGYCSCCGTRNDLQELTQTIETIQQKTRERLTAKERLEAAVPDAVSAFDSTARQYAKQLARRVPMIPARRTPLEGALYHQVAARAEELKSWFDIDLFRGLDPDDVAFVRRMFARRHVYEHNGGEVDARYLEESGDATVKVKQRLREDPESVFRLTGLVLKMAKNLHEGFHALFPPEAMPIRLHEEQQARLEAYRRQHTQPGPPTA